MIDYEKRMDDLHSVIFAAGLNPVVRRMVFRQAIGILTSLGASLDDAEEFLARTVGCLGHHSRFAEKEDEIRRDLWDVCDSSNLPLAMKRRTDLWIDVLDPHLSWISMSDTLSAQDYPLLDLGGGGGELAQRIKEVYGYPVTIADALDWRLDKEIPFVPVIENHVDLPDRSFETVLVVTVFHHTDDPTALMAEAFRLAQRRVIFIESVAEDRTMFHYAAWIDWFYNHILHFNPDITQKINVPCNFKSAREWENLVLKVTGLNPTISQNLGIYQFLNPEQHHFFVYEKK